MTDNEIIKALQMCTNYVSCAKCPLAAKSDCRDIMLEQSLDLINRQKAEIIKEQNKNSKLRNERNRQKAEIETLKMLLSTSNVGMEEDTDA